MAMAISSNLDLLENVNPELGYRISPVMDLATPQKKSLAVDCRSVNKEVRISTEKQCHTNLSSCNDPIRPHR